MDDQGTAMAMNSLCTSGSLVDASLPSYTSTLGSSFVLVSEEDSREMPGLDYVMAQVEPAFDSVEEGREVNRSADIGGGGGGNISQQDKRISDDTSDTFKAEGEGSLVRHQEMTQSASNPVSNSVLCPPCNSSTEGRTVAVERELVQPRLKSASGSNKSYDFLMPNSDNISSCGDLPTPFSPLCSTEVIDMTSSTVMAEKHVMQREARMLKTSNKDLRAKIQKLSEILEEKKASMNNLLEALSERESKLLQVIERESTLEAINEGLAEDVSSLNRRLSAQSEREREQKKHVDALQRQLERSEESRSKLENLNKKLLIQNNTLEQKLKQLSQENKTVFERSSKLLTQLQDMETKREVEKSENKVLRVKLDYLSAELRSLKLSHEAGKHALLPYPHHNEQQQQISKHKPSKPAESAPASGKPAAITAMPATSVRRPKELSLGRTAGHTQGGRSELPQHRAMRSKEPKRAVNGVSGLEQEQQHRSQFVQEHRRVAKHGGTHDALGGGGSRHDDYQTLQEGDLCGVHVGPGSGSRREMGTLLAAGPGVGTLVATGKGAGGRVVMVECPICGKRLQSKENDFGVQLHVEHCIQLSEINEG